MAKIELKNLSKTYNKKIEALHDINFTIEDGQFFVLLGPSGAGKTTTLRCIAGLEKIDNGSILFNDESVTEDQPASRDVCFVFQQYSLYPHYSVYENLAFPLRSPMRKLPEEEIKTKVESIASMLKISNKLNNKATQLSGGEMQRVAIGRALVREPNLYLMDEPLSSLDAKLRESLRVELKNIQTNLNSTILYVTHDQAEATTLADKIGVLKEGHLVQIGTPEEIYENPNSIYVSQRLGSPKINILPGKLFGMDDVPTFGIRPENITIGTGNYSAKIISIENLGSETVVALNFKDQEILVSIQGNYKSSINETINFDMNNEKVLRFDQEGNRIYER
ncbi:ABC transporter ATP-binding protein [Candidatus Pelagibacter sp.]|jgi:multiple sugar transport system ATP-binding protein|nr:ABC transporter ATP-binding protein [Candidatus Pelagibacter sp.]|tara:strand:+ start:610 stop:1617 length:1008 start_codon:yes stop_codon:yes gene_type:complete